MAEQNNNTQPTTRQTKKTGGAHDGGQQFEIKMAAFIGLRGLQRGDNFKLATNVTDAGNFDDLVYTTSDRRYFLQLKHTDNVDKKKLTKGELVTLLQKCFESYCAINERDTLEDIPIVNTEYIIYTNRELGRNLLKHRTQPANIDVFFITCDKEIFTSNPEENKQILQDLITEQDGTHDFLEKLIIATGQKGHLQLDELIAEEMRNNDAVQVDHKEYKLILNHLKPSLETWWRERKCEMTPERLTVWLQRAKTEYSTLLVRGVECTKDFVRKGVEFSNREILRLEAEISNKRAVHLRSDALTLCSILLLDCLPQSKCIFVTLESLQSNENVLLHAWLGGVCECLIVSCDATVQQSDITDTCLKMSEIIKLDRSLKRVILLTEHTFHQVAGFVPIDHRFKFEQLSKKSQTMVLDKKIDFQGCEVTMRSVLQRHGNVEHVLGPELVTDLITEETAVNIGGKLHVNTGYYAPRVFKRKIFLPVDILRNQRTYPDVFAVSGLQKNELVDEVPADEEVGNFYFDKDSATENPTQNGMFENSRFIVLTGRNLKSSFLKLHENHNGQSLHWLKYKDGKLLWKETRGDVGNLLDCIDGEGTGIDKRTLRVCMSRGSCEVNEQSIWDLGERRVLVVAEPGMGKSSTTTQVAGHTKQRDPTSWVVRINWNDHTRELQEIDAATFNLDILVEFLCSAAFPDSKYTDINRDLLKKALQSIGNVTVLMDGFDEISPTYADKAAVILSELTETKAGRIWITSRPVLWKTLERKLCVAAFTLKKLSYESQEELFRDVWISNANDMCRKEFIKLLLSKANELIYPRNFTGCPLHIWVMACVFEEYLDRSTRLVQISLPEKLDLLKLYETFVETKLHTYETEKKKEDLTKASVQDDHELLKETYLENFEKCSLLVVVPTRLNLLHDETLEQTTESFKSRAQEGKDKTGVVMNVVEGQPQFVHRTFAEYFTARWFSKNFEANRSVLEGILFDREYEFVRNVFDRILTRGCPLQCAVLDGDTEVVETLLQEGSDVNARDKGGRNAMHLIAAARHGGHICEEITSSLLRHRTCVDAVDNVLQWTPLRYAIRTENRFVIEQLQHNSTVVH